MKLILTEDVPNLGSLGDTIDVKSGYGRNYLFPFGKAVPATKDNLADFEAISMMTRKIYKTIGKIIRNLFDYL